MLQQILLYSYRYYIGYGLFIIVLLGLLTLELTQVPFGISSKEVTSTLQSAASGFSKNTPIADLPYHLLQNLSVSLLGLSPLSIKLPSVIMAAFSGIGLILLLRRWFKENVTIISAVIAVSSSMFLIAGRSGSPDIMIVFWSVYLLLCATLITQEARFLFAWKLLLGLLIGLSLYTPLSIFVLGAAILAGILHPHVRYIIKHFGKREFAGAVLLFVLAVSPLVYGIWRLPEIGLNLLGLPQNIPAFTQYAYNLKSVIVYVAGVTAPYIGETIRPAFNIAALVLILLGILRSLADHHSTRTYALLIWTAILIPVIALNPRLVLAVYVPAMLFLAIGIQTLIREWYSLFPRNPYARLAGLLPLIVLIGGVWYDNYTTYFTGFRYSPNTAGVFNKDLPVLNKDLASRLTNDSVTVTVVVQPEDVAFYKLLNPKFGPQKIAVTTPGLLPNTKADLLVIKPAYQPGIGPIKTYLVSNTKNDSLLWYVVGR